MQCITCGKKTEHLNGKLCDKCYADSIPLIKSLKDIKIIICANCNTLFYKNKWIKYEGLKKALELLVQDKISYNKNFEIKQTTIFPNITKFPINPGIKVKGEISIYAIGDLNGIIKKETKKFDIDVEVTICQRCSKVGTKYFEGILQFRNTTNREFEKVLEEIKQDIQKNMSKGIFSPKQNIVKNGVDFQISSQKYMQALVKKLLSKYGGEVETTSRLFSRNRQTMKNIYRLYIHYRLPDFSLGDVLLINNKLFVIESIHENKANGYLLHNFEKKSFNYKREKIEIVAYKQNIKETTIVKIKPNIEVLHPETFQSYPVENQKELVIGQIVKIVVYQEKLWLI